MGRVADSLSTAQKRELKSRNSLVLENEDLERQNFIYWHNPKTGQEFSRLPVDPYGLANNFNKGLRPGRASEELREKWAAGEGKRQARFDARLKKAKKDPDFARDMKQAESVPATEVAEIAKQAAQEAVAEVLRQLGVPASAVPAAAIEQPSIEAGEAPEEAPESTQLKLL